MIHDSMYGTFTLHIDIYVIVKLSFIALNIEKNDGEFYRKI